jgi:hypothetical protein
MDTPISTGPIGRGVQLVGYETVDAALLVADGGTVERVALEPGTELDYSLGGRHCAGAVEDGRHTSCDRPDAPYCPEHRSTWACARCTGDCDMPLPACREEHAVYLAAFAPDVFKVGVTRSWRLERRLEEQGADRAAHISTVEDGRRARVVEANIASEVVPDRVRVPTKARGLHRTVDDDAWASLVEQFEPVETYRFDYGLDLDRQPVFETLASGTVRGTKGRLLVLDTAGSSYAVDMRDLVGHDLDPAGTGRDLQSSLGAFGE